MKKCHTLLVLLVLIVLGVVAYTSSIEKRAKSPVAEILDPQEDNIWHQNKRNKLVEVGGYASCFIVEIQDLDGNKIDVPKEIEDLYDCGGHQLRLSPDGRYIVYLGAATVLDEGSSLMLHDLDTGSSEILMHYNPGLEGITLHWNPSGTKIASATVNQERTDAAAKIHIINVQDGKLIQSTNLQFSPANKPAYSCGSFCFIPDLEFISDDTLQYPRQEFFIEETGEEFAQIDV